MTCNSGLRMMVLVVVAAGIAAPAEALAVPPRRLARRGVIVVPPPGAEAVVAPAPGSAPVVVGPALRPRRRMVVVPGPVAVPGTPRMEAAPSVAGRQPAAASPAPRPRMPTPAAPAPTTAAASAAAKSRTATSVAKPAATAPEQIPTPRPTPAPSSAVQPTVAAATPAAAESVAFTADWFAKHPQAWRPAKSTADWWKTADVATITAWLGQPVMPAGAAADSGGAVATAGGAGIGADGLQSVLVLPAGHQNAVGPADSDWLPLGVFAVVPPGTQDTAQAHNYQQLAVDRQGAIKGNFYDTLSGTIQPITGTVGRTAINPSSKASWTVGTNGSRFTAPMEVFAGQSRTVSVSTGGQPRDMELMPVQRPY